MTKAKKAATVEKPAPKKVAAEPNAAQIKRLEGYAKEINARLERADVASEKTNDLRLSAAVLLAEAEKWCRENKVNFKKWASENVKWKWENARKLLRVGQAEDPKLALEDLRLKTAKAAKKSRVKKAAAVEGKDPVAVAETALGAMKPAQAKKVVNEHLKAQGLKAVPVGQADSSNLSGVAAAQFALDALNAAEVLEFLKYVVKKTGASITLFGEEVSV